VSSNHLPTAQDTTRRLSTRRRYEAPAAPVAVAGYLRFAALRLKTLGLDRRPPVGRSAGAIFLQPDVRLALRRTRRTALAACVGTPFGAGGSKILDHRPVAVNHRYVAVCR
jgi:hypothetical protein